MILDVDSVCGLIDDNLAELIHTVIVILKFGVPLLLIIFGMLDFAKGVIASKEDEIKKGQQIFIKRLISAVVVFFIVTIVQLVVGLVDDNPDGKSEIWNCAEFILNGNKNAPIPYADESEKCCNDSGGTVSKNSDGTVNCITTTDEQYDKFHSCLFNIK